jgi:hypothetical protein
LLLPIFREHYRGHLIEGITPRRAAEILDSSAADAVATAGNPPPGRALELTAEAIAERFGRYDLALEMHIID